MLTSFCSTRSNRSLILIRSSSFTSRKLTTSRNYPVLWFSISLLEHPASFFEQLASAYMFGKRRNKHGGRPFLLQWDPALVKPLWNLCLHSILPTVISRHATRSASLNLMVMTLWACCCFVLFLPSVTGLLQKKAICLELKTILRIPQCMPSLFVLGLGSYSFVSLAHWCRLQYLRRQSSYHGMLFCQAQHEFCFSLLCWT